eukprot:12896563-Alexandrium_andersonii.AAC.1
MQLHDSPSVMLPSMRNCRAACRVSRSARWFPPTNRHCPARSCRRRVCLSGHRKAGGARSPRCVSLGSLRCEGKAA